MTEREFSEHDLDGHPIAEFLEHHHRTAPHTSDTLEREIEHTVEEAGWSGLVTRDDRPMDVSLRTLLITEQPQLVLSRDIFRGPCYLINSGANPITLGKDMGIAAAAINGFKLPSGASLPIGDNDNYYAVCAEAVALNGVWSAASAYNAGNTVSYNGKTWITAAGVAAPAPVPGTASFTSTNTTGRPGQFVAIPDRASQSFIPTASGTLTSVQFPASAAAVVANVTVWVSATVGGAALGGGTATVTVANPGANPVFTLGTPLAVTAGTTYYVNVIQNSGTDTYVGSVAPYVSSPGVFAGLTCPSAFACGNGNYSTVGTGFYIGFVLSLTVPGANPSPGTDPNNWANDSLSSTLSVSYSRFAGTRTV